MLRDLGTWLGGVATAVVRTANRAFREWLRPSASLALGTAGDLARSKQQLLAENALLRQQLIVARRQINRPKLVPGDRVRMVILASLVERWQEAVLLVEPDTVLRWYREGFRLFWRRKTRTTRSGPRIAFEVISLIEQMAKENVLWGAERIRGELLKLGIRVCKRTIQKYAYAVRGPRRRGQSWTTFLKNHAPDIAAIDFFTVPTATFRVLFCFIVLEHSRRRILHFNVTANPTAEWTGIQIVQALFEPVQGSL